MASRRAAVPAKHLFSGFRAVEQHHTPQRCFTRSMATEAPLPLRTSTLSTPPTQQPTTSTQPQPSTSPPAPTNPFITTATCTLHAFPSLEPTAFTSYPSTHLLLPLRRDILHRAIVYEGDMTRQGTANTKWRSEVHGSGRKIRPQKGTGSARLGDKKSPMLKGGGVAFGPKPRDFSTKLQRKVYDLAWRTALSYRYKKGELVLVEGEVEVDGVHANSAERYVRDLLRRNRMGHADGRTLFVAGERREGLFTALEGENMGREARALEVGEVDVKDLLELGRVVIEREALEMLFAEHESDLVPGQQIGEEVWERLMAGSEGAWIEEVEGVRN